ncbi:protein slowmo isoform X3 [Vespa velutina]|uniref:protein slowmo isoform X3 n=1 Tax=Vespa velutina TaxID=202808 RepID=UPI001FB48A78|nr:protein slowmo isoform X3 [Vespa velutina]
MRIWRTEHTFNHSWETVTQAAWRKYPNPINSSVIGTDVIDRKVIDGILHTHRLVSTRFGFPKWAQALIGHAKICYASEKSEVDPVSREMVLKTRNFSRPTHYSVCGHSAALGWHRNAAINEKQTRRGSLLLLLLLLLLVVATATATATVATAIADIAAVAAATAAAATAAAAAAKVEGLANSGF